MSRFVEDDMSFLQVVGDNTPQLVLDKAFCPTGPGGGVDPTCSPGKDKHSAIKKSLADGSFNYSKLSNENSSERKAMESVIADSMKSLKVDPKKCHGYCALVSVDVHERLGSPKDLKPTSVMYGEEEHVILYNKKEDAVIDPTGAQYRNPTFPGWKENTEYKSFKALTVKEIKDLKLEIEERKSEVGPVDEEEATVEIKEEKVRNPLLSPNVVLGGPPVPQKQFMDYLEKHGKEYPSQALPSYIAPGEKKQCYMNATKLAIENRTMTYVEGVAYTPKLPGMAISHAWVVDMFGKVIDNTWDNPEESQYFGVPIPTNRLSMRLLESKVYGVFGGRDKEARDLIESGEKP